MTRTDRKVRRAARGHERTRYQWRRRESRRIIAAYHRGEKTREQIEEELNRKRIPYAG